MAWRERRKRQQGGGEWGYSGRVKTRKKRHVASLSYSLDLWCSNKAARRKTKNKEVYDIWVMNLSWSFPSLFSRHFLSRVCCMCVEISVFFRHFSVASLRVLVASYSHVTRQTPLTAPFSASLLLSRSSPSTATHRLWPSVSLIILPLPSLPFSSSSSVFPARNAGHH